jgi:putative membrane protein
MTVKNSKGTNKIIMLLGVVIPLVVAVLYVLPKPENMNPGIKAILENSPKFNACINATTFILLILALVAIKAKKVQLHSRLMTSSIALGVLFLLSYVSYHFSFDDTIYPLDSEFRPLYITILISHIVLSAIVVPLVLISYLRGLNGEIERHKKIVKFAYPIWLYVTLTGVVVYLMISPYYAFNQ